MANTDRDTSLVKRVAEAIRVAHVDQARDQLKEKILPLRRIENAFEIARREADRSTSILLFALAEDMMLNCLKDNLNQNISGGWNSVTGGNGVIATASDRLALLELLYWIRPRTASDLRLMKSIRNRFAHHAEVNSFTDSKISGWINSLTPHENPMQSAITFQRKIPLALRELYLIRSIATLMNLATDLAIGPISSKSSLHPEVIVSNEFDSLPENMKDALRTQAELMLRVYKKRYHKKRESQKKMVLK